MITRSQIRYALYNRSAPTSDTEGPWIACDESGNDGENLVARTPVFVSGSVRSDDIRATSAIADIWAHVSSRPQPTDLKFSDIDRDAGVAALAWATGPGGPLRGRAHVYLADKRYVTAGKAIDLLIEEDEHAAGRDIYSTGEARGMARTLFTHGPRAVGRDRFDRLISALVTLFRSREPLSGRTAAVTGFFEAAADARALCAPGRGADPRPIDRRQGARGRFRARPPLGHR